MSTLDIENLVEMFSYEYDIEYAPEELLNKESIEFNKKNAQLSYNATKISDLPKLKSISILPNVGTYGVYAQLDLYDELFEKGIEVKWLNSSQGGEFVFKIQYGSDGYENTDSRKNYYYLFDTPKEMIEFIKNPQPVIESLFDSGSFDGVFKGIEDEIIRESGTDEDMFVDILSVEDNNQEEEIFWKQ